MFEGRYCAYCGKEFFPHKYWAYKKEFSKHPKRFCSYSCMLKYKEEHQKKKEDTDGLE